MKFCKSFQFQKFLEFLQNTSQLSCKKHFQEMIFFDTRFSANLPPLSILPENQFFLKFLKSFHHQIVENLPYNSTRIVRFLKYARKWGFWKILFFSKKPNFRAYLRNLTILVAFYGKLATI